MTDWVQTIGLIILSVAVVITNVTLVRHVRDHR